MPRPRTLLVVIAALAVVAVAAIVVLLVLHPRLLATPSLPEEPAPRWVPPAPAPPRAADPVGFADLADADWVVAVAAATGIPERALRSYAAATIRKGEQMPACALSWTTLAAIGSVESDHGRHGGSSLGEDGVATPPIYGIALDGASTANIPDSDGGELDGDPDHDRAVGPLQLIPQTWRNWHVDADGDGVENPQDLDDAAMAAANYLCRASSPQDDEAGWRAAIAAYNSAPAYLDAVARRAQTYAEAAAALPSSPAP